MPFKVRPPRYVMSTWILIHFMHFYCGMWKRYTHIYTNTYALRWYFCSVEKRAYIPKASFHWIFRIYIYYSVYGFSSAQATTKANNPYRVFVLYIRSVNHTVASRIFLKHFSYILCITRDQHATHPLLNSLSILMHVFIICIILFALLMFVSPFSCVRSKYL